MELIIKDVTSNKPTFFNQINDSFLFLISLTNITVSDVPMSQCKEGQRVTITSQPSFSKALPSFSKSLPSFSKPAKKTGVRSKK